MSGAAWKINVAAKSEPAAVRHAACRLLPCAALVSSFVRSLPDGSLVSSLDGSLVRSLDGSLVSSFLRSLPNCPRLPCPRCVCPVVLVCPLVHVSSRRHTDTRNFARSHGGGAQGRVCVRRAAATAHGGLGGGA